jgi:hypothetical protein
MQPEVERQRNKQCAIIQNSHFIANDISECHWIVIFGVGRRARAAEVLVKIDVL